jgi:hypothetical protein
MYIDQAAFAGAQQAQYGRKGVKTPSNAGSLLKTGNESRRRSFDMILTFFRLT